MNLSNMIYPEQNVYILVREAYFLYSRTYVYGFFLSFFLQWDHFQEIPRIETLCNIRQLKKLKRNESESLHVPSNQVRHTFFQLTCSGVSIMLLTDFNSLISHSIFHHIQIQIRYDVLIDFNIDMWFHRFKFSYHVYQVILMHAYMNQNS